MKRRRFLTAEPGPEEAGRREGEERGWRDGACETVAALIAPPVPRVRDLRLLYIKQGFDAIDEGLIAALSGAVRELHVAEPARMLEAARAAMPERMLVLNGLHVFPADHLEQADAVRALGIRTAIWFADDPYFTADTVRIAPHYDTVFTHESSTLELYRQIGCRDVRQLALGAHIGRFRPLRVPDRYRSDICFIGQGFRNRVDLLDAAAPVLAGRRVFIAGGLWDRLRRKKLLRPFVRHGWLPVDESILYYSGAKIVINIHRPTEAWNDNRNALGLPGHSVNPRTFEIAACGAFQLTDVRPELPLHYRPGLELETFASSEELTGKLLHYLAHPEERGRIAVRGLRRTLREHTFPHRVELLLDALGAE